MNIALSVRNIRKNFGSFTAVDDVSFDVEDGKFFSILGPSGCGKTTLLRMIAGFYHQDEGVIELNKENMEDIAPNERPVNLVFQNLALFPMMNVHENIAFGLRRRKVKKAIVDKKVEEMLERVGLPGIGNKSVDQLSGGQRQRIAIARALILEPTVLLLDEPLGALDAKLREHMKVELKTLQAQVGTTFVYITHDQSEAMVMSDKVAVMNKGKFEQLGTPRELYYEPATSFVAKFVGDNNRLEVIPQKNLVAQYEKLYSFTLPTNTSDYEEGELYDMFLRPESIIIEPKGDTSHMNHLPVKVESVLFDGAASRLMVHPKGLQTLLTVALPQTREYDYIKIADEIEIGWDIDSPVMFKQEGE
jgi:spermidine/putrescine transport system ATP-binding protein